MHAVVFPVVAAKELRVRKKGLPVAFILGRFEELVDLLVLFDYAGDVSLHEVVVHFKCIVSLFELGSMLPQWFHLFLLKCLLDAD